ncbi:MAG: SPASM domain-containing protein [Clostridia bacterium]|nr:SPASM domain-containing protein [Clostridia bacterium]
MRFKRIYIEITNVCNLKCSFCPPHNRENRFMNFEEFKSILNTIKPYTKYIYLHVKGEPLLHPEFDQFVKYAFLEGFQINLTTNATMLHEHLQITKYLRQINISLHATNSEFIVNTAKNINDTIINFRIWNKSLNKEAFLLLEKAFDVKIPNVKNFTLAKNIFLSQEELFDWPNLNMNKIHENGYCHALRTQIAILVDGTVVPCCLDNNGDINLGNIFSESFENILNSNKVYEIMQAFQNRKAIEELCKKCTFKDKF